MSRIVHYEQRLKALFYKKSFTERINVTRPKISSIHEASRQLAKSHRLKKALEIILAFGNYMNKGQRGNANGFKIASLNKVRERCSAMFWLICNFGGFIFANGFKIALLNKVREMFCHVLANL